VMTASRGRTVAVPVVVPGGSSQGQHQLAAVWPAEPGGEATRGRSARSHTNVTMTGWPSAPAVPNLVSATGMETVTPAAVAPLW